MQEELNVGRNIFSGRNISALKGYTKVQLNFWMAIELQRANKLNLCLVAKSRVHFIKGSQRISSNSRYSDRSFKS